jgi:hypothetical protein
LKRKLVCILLVLATSIILGYLFFAGWLLGFVLTKYMAGKTSGKQGRIRSIVIPFGRHGVHLHHWLISSWIIILSLIIDVQFLASAISYGILGGLVFQGIYCYSDWHKILIPRRHQGIENTAVCNLGRRRPRIEPRWDLTT